MKKLLIALILACATASGQVISGTGTVLNGGVTATYRWVPVTMATSTWTSASAHGLSNGDSVIFKSSGTLPSVSGDTWAGGTVAPITVIEPGRVYYVTNTASTTFQIASYVGGAALTLSSGSGTHYVNLVTRKDLTLGVNRDGAITAQPYDSTILGGNLRGAFALDLQRGRTAANQVAETTGSIILTGINNRVTTYGGVTGTLYGAYGGVLSGYGNLMTHNGRGSLMGGLDNSLTGGASTSLIFGERNYIMGGSGQAMIVLGSQGLGGCQDLFMTGFHNLANGVGSTDLGAAGAQIGAVGAGSILTGAGGSNMQAFGAGVHAYWTGCEFRSNHANKDKAMIRGNLILDTSSSTAMGTIAKAGTRTNEFYMMGYYPDSIMQQASNVDTGTDVFTGISTALAANTPVRVLSTDDLPAPLVADTTYYIKSPSGTTFQLSATAGGAAIDITTTGTGVMGVTQYFGATDSGPRWCRLFPSKLYTWNFTVEATLKSATTPTYAVWQRRVTYLQGATIPSEPTIVGSVQTVGTDVGSNAGGPPASWTLNLTVATDGLHVSVTVLNNDGTARNVHATAAFECVEINTL